VLGGVRLGFAKFLVVSLVSFTGRGLSLLVPEGWHSVPRLMFAPSPQFRNEIGNPFCDSFYRKNCAFLLFA
jgi:hypothetical protein